MADDVNKSSQANPGSAGESRWRRLLRREKKDPAASNTSPEIVNDMARDDASPATQAENPSRDSGSALSQPSATETVHGESAGAGNTQGEQKGKEDSRWWSFGRGGQTAEPDQSLPPAVAENDNYQTKPQSRIRSALSRTGQGIINVFLGKKAIDDDLLEDLETRLLTADLGLEVTAEVIEKLTERVRRKELDNVSALQAALRHILAEILKPCEKPLVIEGHKPFVIMVVGVNGVGKTTTIGKLARQYLHQGRSVMLAAGDTFRAAAVEQLQVWGQRNQVPVVAQHTGADSASVIYDAAESAAARNIEVLIADTAGRLHTKNNLMEELKKIRRVVGKVDNTAPHEVLLVLDAGTGQNAVVQMQQFHQTVGVTGVVLTKLDGTAKGGVIFALCRKFGVPVRYIGVGEGVEDLQPFIAEDFVEALLSP